MKLTVNGVVEDLAESLTIDVFLEHFGYDPRKIAVEVNKEIVVKSMYSQVPLDDGDVVEVVTFVGGG